MNEQHKPAAAQLSESNTGAKLQQDGVFGDARGTHAIVGAPHVPARHGSAMGVNGGGWKGIGTKGGGQEKRKRESDDDDDNGDEGAR